MEFNSNELEFGKNKKIEIPRHSKKHNLINLKVESDPFQIFRHNELYNYGKKLENRNSKTNMKMNLFKTYN